ncbi:hypothetical protein DPMN_061964 [Dreissena polymorpha]|uniref:Dynein heavy chain tail domain-containing protein n=1 Tax=Dreissena polymorpha TaxID=45954 RepID=A0A9D4HIX5_DREPO|nr:hypothetical protein DPMN_061964 [Dreissena polymorpha]
MMQSVITSAFETITTPEDGVELLDIFIHLSGREAIKCTIDKKTVGVYSMFNEERNTVKELTQKSIPQSPSHVKFAGQALWARQLKHRIERSMMIQETILNIQFVLLDCSHRQNSILPHCTE